MRLLFKVEQCVKPHKTEFWAMKAGSFDPVFLFLRVALLQLCISVQERPYFFKISLSIEISLLDPFSNRIGLTEF